MKALLTIVYKPFGILVGIVAGLFSTKIFNWLWGHIDEQEAPKPNTQAAPLGKILAAAALQGMVFKVVRATVDRQMAKGVHFVTGIWPGERKPDRTE